VDRFTAKKLEFSGAKIGNIPLVVVNADSKWKDEAGKTEIKGEKIQDLLDKLSGNRIKDFLDGKTVPAGESAGLKLVLGDEKSPKKRELVFWKSGSKLFGRDLLSKRSEAFLIDDALAAALPFTRDAFKDTPLAMPSGAPPAPAALSAALPDLTKGLPSSALPTKNPSRK
jgi:hypothetical protein